MCGNLDVSKLETFVDEDGDINSADEIECQQFLQRTPNLVDLSVLVDTPRIFDWTVAALQHQEQKQSCELIPLPAVWRLKLWTRIDENILGPAHDAARICGTTVEQLHLSQWYPMKKARHVDGTADFKMTLE